MIRDPRFLMLIGGLCALLLVATVIGIVLARRVQTSSGQETVRNLNDRVRSWWIMVAWLAAALGLGRSVTIGFYGLLSLMAFREFVTLTPTRRGDHRALFLAFFAVIPMQYWLISVDWYGLMAVFIPVYVFFAIPALSAVEGDTRDFLARNAKVQWGMLLTVYALSHAPALMMLHIPGYTLPSPFLMIYLLTIVQLSDVFQYVAGKLFGRHKLATSVSPSKTVEGLLGGGLAAILVGALLHGLTPFSPLQAAGMSMLIVAAGFLGGLILSAIKRDLGVKDWGTLIRGHGGVLDRLDSICFAAPLFFHLTRFYFAET